ncbi:MAG: hypothetical protein HUJ69_05045 [Lachnospiraceae bacterium]|nr:hypothetical protein [Lachnospiraceae bacterium]
MTEQTKAKLKRRLQESRNRIILREPELGLPLRDMYFVAVKGKDVVSEKDSVSEREPTNEMCRINEMRRISTNGSIIYLDPDWFLKLKPESADFILAHQLMHIRLGHICRSLLYRGDRYHLAADIVANAGLGLLGWEQDKLPGLGTIYRETFYPRISGQELTAEEALRFVPFDPDKMPERTRLTYRIDSDFGWGRRDDPYSFGTLILSPEDGDPPDLLPLNTKGKGNRKLLYFFENNQSISGDEARNAPERRDVAPEDTHAGTWEHMAVGDLEQLRQEKREHDRREEHSGETRSWKRINSSQVDWRSLLNFYAREEVGDYSFTPPDRRYADSDWFLPDFNEQTERPRKVLFMVDASGSVDEECLSLAREEICQALAQSGGKLAGLLAFFDVKVYGPMPIQTSEELTAVIPRGGGGTDFGCIFRYVKEQMQEDPPVSIVVFTDGDGHFPPETEAGETPVLWLFTSEKAVAPWGRYVRIRP